MVAYPGSRRSARRACPNKPTCSRYRRDTSSATQCISCSRLQARWLLTSTCCKRRLCARTICPTPPSPLAYGRLNRANRPPGHREMDGSRGAAHRVHGGAALKQLFTGGSRCIERLARHYPLKRGRPVAREVFGGACAGGDDLFTLGPLVDIGLSYRLNRPDPGTNARGLWQWLDGKSQFSVSLSSQNTSHPSIRAIRDWVLSNPSLLLDVSVLVDRRLWSMEMFAECWPKRWAAACRSSSNRPGRRLDTAC